MILRIQEDELELLRDIFGRIAATVADTPIENLGVKRVELVKRIDDKLTTLERVRRKNYTPERKRVEARTL